jgi:predicted MFS family arabinose efflux permease
MLHAMTTSPTRTALQLALGPMVALGFARFAYAVLLPAMREALALDFTQAGLLGTANAAGYLAGTAITPAVTRWLGTKRSFDVFGVVTAVAVLLTGLFPLFGWVALIRFITGVTGAVVFIAGSALAARLATDSGRPPALLVATYFSGVGLGLTLTALLVPPILNLDLGLATGMGWRAGWAALGIVGLIGLLLLRATGAFADPPAASTQRAVPIDLRPLAAILIAYLLFGLGYITYMTFIVAYVQTRLPAWIWLTVAWGLLGSVMVASPRIWRRMLDGAPGGVAYSAVMAVLMLAVLLPLLSQSLIAILASTALFGSFLIAVSAITVYVRRALPPAQWISALSIATAAFALGQIFGPTLSGWLADLTGNLSAGLWMSAATLGLGAVFALFHRK